MLRYALPNGIRRKLVHFGYHSRPSFLIIGAQKAGTTALYYYLAGHPDIVPGRDKEIGFFTPETFTRLPDHPHHSVLCRDIGSIFSDPGAYAAAAEWYHGLFPPPHTLGHRGVTFEATPEYLYFPSAPQRIFSYHPRMKLIALLRDPVERAFSAWNMYHNFDDPIYSRIRDIRSFERAIDDELNDIEVDESSIGPDYVRRGLYAAQLRRYSRLFPPDQLLWIDSRRLQSDTSAVLNEVARFLGLRPFSGGHTWTPMHVGRYEQGLAPESVRFLREFYRPHNQELYDLLKHDFGWP
jgi:hypothetical protein